MNKFFVIMLGVAVLAVIYFTTRPETGQEAVSKNELSAESVVASGKIARNTPVALVEDQPSRKVMPDKNDIEARYKAVSDNAQMPSLEQRITELKNLYPYREFSADEVLDLLGEPNAWQSSAEIPDNLPLTQAQHKDGRTFIELNPERFQVLLPGDTIELPLEQLGMNLQMQVDSREALANGGFTLHGHLLGSDELMRVTITQGPGLSVAGIDTPQGHVVMQANDTNGWIASSETLFKQNPDTTDVLLPTDE